MDGQPRIADLIPQKYSTILLLFLAGLTVVAGLEALYLWMPDLAAHTTDGRVAAFDLDSEGSLGACFSTATFWLAGLLAIFVYTIRRNKEDDYQGRYRIWLWAAFCWIAMGIDEAASLHEGFKEMMTLITGTRITGDGSMWWVIAYALVLGYIGTRLLLEMRVCRSSTAALIATGICYVVAVVVQLGWILPETGARGVMVEEGCEMVGNLFLVLAMTLHARYVILQSQGLLPQRRKKEDQSGTKEAAESKPRRRQRQQATAETTSQATTDLPTTAPAQAPARSSTRVDAAEERSTAKPRLSKAERRAMRRRKREEREEF